ncbi:MAG: prepilin-type N-terminal cleavage/methylation domain-containing protein [Armatimonadetes bacterium]|nr:prepilin-type N-terminal cleavage/methylation domain-containing protein [Armatimonadota bacterium]
MRGPGQKCKSGGVGRSLLRPAADTAAATPGFTVVELLVVMAIILVLAGLVLATSSYVHNKGARARAEAEIAALSAALENYKADNGVYPRGNANLSNSTPYDTDKLNAGSDINSDPGLNGSNYLPASVYLFIQLSGSNASQTPISGAKSYFAFKPQMLGGTVNGTGTVTYLRDPFGNSYGYSTINSTDSTKGYNPTFDLWSTANYTPPSASPTPTPQNTWIKNW